MRIAYVCADFGIPIHGSKGASIHVRELTRALAASGNELLVLTPRRGGTAPPGYGVVVVEIAPDALDGDLRRLVAADEAGGEALASEVRGLLYASALRHRSAALLRDWRPDVIYERHALPALAGGALANELGVPHLLEVNAPLAREHARHRTIHLNSTVVALEERALATADAIFTVSASLARWAIGSGAHARRVHVLPNAVDPQRFAMAGGGAAIRGRLRLDDGVPVIGFVGTLKPWHDVAGLFRAAGLLRRRGIATRVLIVGDGPQRAELEQAAITEGLAAETRFTGAVPHEEIPAHLAAMDVAAVPYADTTDEDYFSPLKLFEYGAAGLPVIAADRGEIGHCIRDGATGVPYRSGDAEALSEGLARVLGDRAGAARMGEALRSHVTAEHTWAGNARTVVDVADRLRARPLLPAGSPR
jgi:glycosyltransferase involved in cell wall biosynthesis